MMPIRVWATAKMALASPRLPKRRRKRWYCAPRWVLRVRVAAQAASTSAVRSAASPLRARPERRLPADSWLPGHSPAQDARCAAVEKRLMSVPISATITHAVRRPIPGMLPSRSIAAEKGAASVSTWVSRPSMAAVRWSMWSSRVRSSSAWCSLNPPSSASRSSGILGRIRVRASSASTAGSRSPAISSSSMARAALPSTSETTESSLIPASSSTRCTRWISRVRSSVSFLAYRVRSRSRAIVGVGTKLPRSRPHSASWANQAASQDVGLAPADVLHVLGVAQQQLIAVRGLQHVPDRLLLRAGGLHRHLGHPLGEQPAAQLPQCRGEGAVLPDLLLPALPMGGRSADRRHDGVLVHVQTRAPVHQHVHLEGPLSAVGGTAHGTSACRESDTRARSNSRWCPEAPAPV